jgi:hypothetical protein
MGMNGDEAFVWSPSLSSAEGGGLQLLQPCPSEDAAASRAHTPRMTNWITLPSIIDNTKFNLLGRKGHHHRSPCPVSKL